MNRIWIIVAALAGLTIIAAPAYAMPIPAPDELMKPAEKTLFYEALRAAAGKIDDETQALPILDGLLAKVPEPTPFRGYIQLLRARTLRQMNRNRDAVVAVDESVRLLPGYSLPLLVASDVYAYSNRPGEAADFLLRASEIDPELIRNVDDYTLFNLLHRLGAANDERRLAAVGDRLLAIGWTGKELTMRSTLALQAIRRKVTDGQLDEARALVPELLSPGASYGLLTDKRYMAIWPDLERWGGPKLSKQWKVYLDEARARWNASKDLQAARDYADALSAAGRQADIVTAFLPLFFRKIDPERDYHLLFLQAAVGDALVKQGRWEDVDKMYAAAEKAWPLGSQANALNLTANHATYLLEEGKAAEASTCSTVRSPTRRAEVTRSTWMPPQRCIRAACARFINCTGTAKAQRRSRLRCRPPHLQALLACNCASATMRARGAC